MEVLKVGLISHRKPPGCHPKSLRSSRAAGIFSAEGMAALGKGLTGANWANWASWVPCLDRELELLERAQEWNSEFSDDFAFTKVYVPLFEVCSTCLTC